MNDQIEIFDAHGEQVGHAKAMLCHSLEELNTKIVVDRLPGDWAFFQSQFPYSDFWPIFAFIDILVVEGYQKRGHGTRAFQEITDHYQERGAKLGLLRIGTQGEDFFEGVVWRKAMYSGLGWIELQRQPEDKCVIPLMYLPMRQRKIISDQGNRRIKVSKENPIGKLPHCPL